MGRFRVVSADEAYSRGWIEDEGRFNSGWALLEFDDAGKFLRVVGQDGGEPEDQLLIRHWSWVVDELNELDRRPAKLERYLEAEHKVNLERFNEVIRLRGDLMQMQARAEEAQAESERLRRDLARIKDERDILFLRSCSEEDLERAVELLDPETREQLYGMLVAERLRRRGPAPL